jgi:hypothetical protein
MSRSSGTFERHVPERWLIATALLARTSLAIARMSSSASSVTLRLEALVKMASATCSPFGNVITPTSFVVPGIVPVLCASVAPSGSAALMRRGPVGESDMRLTSRMWLRPDSPSRLFQNATRRSAIASGVVVSRASTA